MAPNSLAPSRVGSAALHDDVMRKRSRQQYRAAESGKGQMVSLLAHVPHVQESSVASGRDFPFLLARCTI